MTDKTLLDIKWALNALQCRQPAYQLASRYYEGDHDLSFASERFRNTYGRQLRNLKANLLPVVIDTKASRLSINGFEVLNTGTREADLSDTVQERYEKHAQEIWRRCRLEERATDIHRTALKLGDAYLLIWKDDEGRARITYEYPEQMAVSNHPEVPGLITRAAKWFVDDEKIRLNLYYPDRIEKYVTRNNVAGTYIVNDANGFERIEGDWLIPNPLGKVPVVKFSHNADVGKSGRSDLEGLIPLQDSLNKLYCDLMVSSETTAYPQRMITGLTDAQLNKDDNGNIISPFKSGEDALWLLFGETSNGVSASTFAASDDSQIINRINCLREQMAIQSSIPLHRFIAVQGGFPSGEAIKSSEAPLTEFIKECQLRWGNNWADVMRLAMQVEGAEDVHLQTVWANTAPRLEMQEVQTAVLKVTQLGVPIATVQTELGYSAREVALFEVERLNNEQQMEQARNRSLGASLE